MMKQQVNRTDNDKVPLLCEELFDVLNGRGQDHSFEHGEKQEAKSRALGAGRMCWFKRPWAASNDCVLVSAFAWSEVPSVGHPSQCACIGKMSGSREFSEAS